MECITPVTIHGIQRPCGKCMACKISRTTDWTIRNCCEYAYHDTASFVTLTYNDDNLPKDFSVHKRELQCFFDDLQHRFKAHDGRKIKYFACGEYGGERNRPHY